MKEQIQGFLSELDSIYRKAFELGEVKLGWERLDRWKRRVAQFLEENLSEQEAQPFWGGVNDWTDLGDEIKKCASVLVALIEELESHPEMGRRHPVATHPSSTPEEDHRTDKTELIEMKPGIYGIHLNIRELCRRLREWFKAG